MASMGGVRLRLPHHFELSPMGKQNARQRLPMGAAGAHMVESMCADAFPIGATPEDVASIARALSCHMFTE